MSAPSNMASYSGALASIHGLVSVEGSKLNGRMGTVMGFAVETCWLKIRSDDAEASATSKLVKAGNFRDLEAVMRRDDQSYSL